MGFPREIQCDQGTSFTSALTTEFFERFGILVSGIVLCIIHRITLLRAISSNVETTLTSLMFRCRLRMGQTSSVNSFSVTNCISRKYRVYTVRVGVWEKFANPRDVSNGTLDGTGRG
ncbi:hypothetical protein TNCV_4969801 [Trichonephila clavipes]|nr:hypothetical protein TNCV_4969801 [Trichonephila clavipes]